MKPLLLPLLRQLADGRFHSGETLARSLGVCRATVWQTLREVEGLGLQLFRVRGKGYRLTSIEFIDAQSIDAALPSASGLAIEVVDSVDSTNSQLMREAANGAPHGRVLVAEQQTGGRGRQGRHWHAGFAGGITFSLLWRFDGGVAALSGLSLAAGIAVARACEALGASGVQLKWPNDVVHNGRKLAGVLIEVQGDMLGPSSAVIGIGFNYRLATAMRERIDQPVVDLADIMAAPPSRNSVLAEMLRAFSDLLPRFAVEGFTPLVEEWQSRHAHQGKQVRLTLPDRSSVQGIALGVGADGALRVRAPSGVLRFSLGEVSLMRRTAVDVT